jgi:hypothetical protein
MAFANSGQLSLKTLAQAYGDTAPYSMSERYGGQGLPSSGEFQMADFYGKQPPPIRTLTYTSSSTHVVGAGTNVVRAWIQGGGGGGGNGRSNSGYGARGGGGAGGGGGGAVTEVAIGAGSSVSVTVGGGGGSASAGGASSYGSYASANGGGGGGSVYWNRSAWGGGGAGGTGAGGNIGNYTGNAGGNGLGATSGASTMNYTSYNGALIADVSSVTNSANSYGANGEHANNSGDGYGVGGGGAAYRDNSVQYYGGSGRQGVVYVEEFGG